MSYTNTDRDTKNKYDFNEPIKLNNIPNTNPIPLTTNVYNQERITYTRVIKKVMRLNLYLLHFKSNLIKIFP